MYNADCGQPTSTVIVVRPEAEGELEVILTYGVTSFEFNVNMQLLYLYIMLCVRSNTSFFCLFYVRKFASTIKEETPKSEKETIEKKKNWIAEKTGREHTDFTLMCTFFFNK